MLLCYYKTNGVALVFWSELFMVCVIQFLFDAHVSLSPEFN